MYPATTEEQVSGLAIKTAHTSRLMMNRKIGKQEQRYFHSTYKVI